MHMIVVIYGFTAILGKLIHTDAFVLVFYRTSIAALVLGVFIFLKKSKFQVSRKLLGKLIFTGAVVAAHWICFFHSIKIANVSVALVCLASTTLFTAFLEPLFHKQKIKLLEVIIGLIVIIGIYLIFQFGTNYYLGIIVALLSALLAALFTVLNKQLIQKSDAVTIAFYEMMVGAVAVFIFILFTTKADWLQFNIGVMDFIYILILATICTAFAFVIQVSVMKQLSAYFVALAINMEPIYGIVLAYFIFGASEYMSLGFYAGAALIIISVFGYSIGKKYGMKKI